MIYTPANIISMDAPWKYPDRNNPATKFGKGMTRYPGMTRAQILALPVGQIAAKDAALFFWVTAPKIQRKYVPLKIMFECFEAWGFDYKTLAFVWVKLDKKKRPRKLPGHHTASNVELCFLAKRGKLPLIEKMVPQVIGSQLSHHSRKPDEARQRMVRMFGDLPRVELFATEQVPGWLSWGHALTGNQTMEEFFGL